MVEVEWVLADHALCMHRHAAVHCKKGASAGTAETARAVVLLFLTLR